MVPGSHHSSRHYTETIANRSFQWGPLTDACARPGPQAVDDGVELDKPLGGLSFAVTQTFSVFDRI
jgi:hypothetical protein